MYNSYLLIHGIKALNHDELDTLQSVLNDIISPDRMNIEGNFLIVLKNDFESIHYEELISMINSDLFSDLSLYESPILDNQNVIQTDIEKKMLTLRFQSSYLNDKTLFYENLSSHIDEETKKRILKMFYEDDDYLRAIKVFIECNQNTSEAAKQLYMHRNTLINRIEKFNRETGYDLKKFEDAAIIYLLVKNL